MGKRILVIDSGQGGRHFFGLMLKRWSEAGSELYLWSADEQLSKMAMDNHWRFFACPVMTDVFLTWQQKLKLFFLKLKLSATIWRGGYDAVIMLNWPEKMMLSRTVNRRHCRLLWLEDGAMDYGRLPTVSSIKLFKQSAGAKVWAVNQAVVAYLAEIGYNQTCIRLIPDCARPKLTQADLLQNLARHYKLRQDYFTIGAKIDWQSGRQAEILIKALQICLEVSDHFQLVLIGDGPAREQIKWLIKRWHLEARVWLVGEQVRSEKWLDGFSVLTLAGDHPDWDDLTLAITAIAGRTMVIGQSDTIMHNLLTQEFGREADVNDSQALAEVWLDLYQHPKAINKYPSNDSAQRLVEFETLADKLLAII